MTTLLRIEFVKLLKNRLFWLTVLGYLAAIVLALTIFKFEIDNINQRTSAMVKGLKILPSDIYKFPGVWENLTFIMKYMKIFLAVILSILITNEYSYNTLRQGFINGLSRNQLLLSKYLIAVLLALFSTLFIFTFGMVSGYFAGSTDLSYENVFSSVSSLFWYFILLVNYFSIIIFISFLVKKSGVALGIILIYFYILEPSLSFLPNDLGDFTPLSVINALVPLPADSPLSRLIFSNASKVQFDWWNVVYSFIYSAVFYYSSLLLLKKRNL